jgi:hypothetical protein
MCDYVFYITPERRKNGAKRDLSLCLHVYLFSSLLGNGSVSMFPRQRTQVSTRSVLYRREVGD